MTSMKQRGKVAGLSFLAAFSLMALITGSAQANWLVEGIELKSNEAVSITAFTPFILTVAKKNIEIQCTTVKGSSFKLLASSATAEGGFELSNCSTFSPIGSGTVQTKCKPEEPIKGGGKTLIVLHNGKNYFLDHPFPNLYFLWVKAPETCALFESTEIKGSLVLECGHLSPPGTWHFLDCANNERPHLVRPASEALFPSDSLLFGSAVAKVSGILALDLSGANAGKAWAGHV